MPEPQLRIEGSRGVCQGDLTANSVGALWGAIRLPENPGELHVDLSGLGACDGAGIAFLYGLKSRIEALGGTCAFDAAPEGVVSVLTAYEQAASAIQPPAPAARPSLAVRTGRFTHEVAVECVRTLAYIGELTVDCAAALLRPSLVRRGDFMLTLEQAGARAIPVVMLIGFLLGLILAFQSAMPMRMFGAEVYVGGLVGISIVRELGPLITAILLTGRSGSAFAAEIGTMKVNEEIDALETMGLDPVRFLALPRVLAGTIAMPILSLFGTFAGLLGGWVVMTSLGFPLSVYISQIKNFVTVGDLLGGLIKALFFGLLVSAVGCRCGLEAGRDAGAVGQSTTRSVVTGIVLIAVADGVFAVLFYVMGW